MPPPAPSTGSKGTVWIVDDSPLEIEAARRALAPGHAVEAFVDGSTVLERLAGRDAPDVLVLDWVMPGLSGLEVCQFLRSKPETVELAILILTAQQGVGQVVEGLAAGANDYVKKPFAPEELIARVDALIRSKRLRERAERAETTVRQLLANLPDPLITTDLEEVVTFVNVEAELMFGTAREALVGKHLGTLLPGLSIRSGDLAADGALVGLADVKVGDQVYSPVARRLMSPDPPGTAISLRNVTHQRLAEARRLDFYSIVAHDLRAPLAAMILRLDVMAESYRGAGPSTLDTDLAKVKLRIRELLAMVDDFLQYARLESPAFSLERREVDLATLVAETSDDFKPLADAGSIRIDMDTGVTRAPVVGDRRRLRQVLTNLIGNAIKFTPPGGTVRTVVEATPDAVVARVEDTGRGIAPEVLPGLFRRYVRALDSEHEVAGTGLGLMIVRQIVEAHGGTVGVESEPDRGSTFWFRLPTSGAPGPAKG